LRGNFEAVEREEKREGREGKEGRVGKTPRKNSGYGLDHM